jgi:hypothetical protein
MEEGELGASSIITRPRDYGFFFPPGGCGLDAARSLAVAAVPVIGTPSTADRRFVRISTALFGFVPLLMSELTSLPNATS